MAGVGKGRAWGAVSILNATATGRGCSLAITAPTAATWHGRPGPGLEFAGPDDRVVRAVAGGLGGRVEVTCPFPPARGLKTSSSVAVALVRARRALVDESADDPETEATACVTTAGVTLTGAFDDQVAVARGGCHITENGARSIVARIAVPPWHVAVWVPEASIPKELAASIPTAPAQAGAAAAEALLRAGDVPGAMTCNGAAFSRLYASRGLPVTGEPARVALAAGALGAGLSGTGPAVAALFDDLPPQLPPVAGGRWEYHRVATGPP